MIAQLAGIRIGVTGAARKYKLYGSQELFISLNQQVTILFRRKTAEKKNVVACCETPSCEPGRRTLLSDDGPVRHIRNPIEVS